ncbi:MAG: di-trans,poly-cis-decaprenylcistransferase, partial [Actinobacteria bacterium]|nr:di-trans,poly-cis-decaprenylcistransferase [Actinomycetota bacterium]
CKSIIAGKNGIRQWAAKNNGSKAKSGHAAGAQKIFDFLSWCDELHVPVITLYLLSTENLKQRSQQELQDLFVILEDLAKEMVSRGNWKIRVMGDRSALSKDFLESLEKSEAESANTEGATVNLAIGYGGRQEITDAMRSIVQSSIASGDDLSKLSDSLTPELIASHLYTSDQPDPDLIIRTSGEQRLSGFLLWQSSNSELYFEEALWPDFRKVDFLRAIRAFTRRHRRFGA